MKRKHLFILFIFLFTLAFVLPAYAVFCSQCGTQNPDNAEYCSQCGAELFNPSGADEKADIYSQASGLISRYSYDEAISLLDKYCADNPGDTKATILLAKAYLGKCTLLKENDDEKYKTLVYRPFNMGKLLITQNPNNSRYLSEGLYVCAHSFLINHRSYKAKRYIKKAMKLSPSPSADIDYYFVLADANAEIARVAYRRSNKSEIPSQYYQAEKTYNEILAMDLADELKSQAYYKMGILHANLKKKDKAKTALESALQLTTNEISISRIRKQLESIEK